ncbi:peptidoglycan DD-metalloendopeptidase family protein [Geoalkalibacter halelectricus]|uniref:Peptidoglycan DD-metalloendopeptidase family protein n=1 Tax=Geoalkalibacter halelectricus TaxID=2847045 RepID=A0ABY5ZV94_9BACT|nr:peptidoglycan DD-metalloendopeptidase family protein [Geoalkalibacter halelectricus]MDO3376902.1 peptidoglycan DD-metalloendopeptidase family protein [Geoalkalibacter halelectricus]UWZ81126.1 peptidoglycan DD-metalloendopeptidase family protein [Geoalkalibacter halelectricus]
MNRDYNPPNSSRLRRGGRRHLPVLLTALIAVVAVGIFFHRSSVTPTQAHLAPEQPPSLSQTEPVSLEAAPEIERETISGVISPGDTLSALLGDYLSSQEIHRLAQKSRPVFPLTGICAGQPFELCLQDGDFESFLYEINRNEQLLIRRSGEKFEISRIPIPFTVEVEVVGGTISSSLFNAVTAIGESAELAIKIADIFAWDIDFIRDIREGDSFQALVEKRFRDGNRSGYGRILAAEFINQGNAHRAVLYQDGDRRPDYFDPEGTSLRKAFLRAPLEFTRISSGFTMRRFHPVTKTWRAHPAIDYAAPTGTPIMTVGDGTIARIGYTNANGNYIQVRHANGYATMYLHMSRFAQGMKQGKQVRQGEVIGYVGATGLATGPHLCFRMTRNGEPVNPQRIRPPSAPAVTAENLEDFKAATAPLLARLEQSGLRQADLASDESAQNP